MNTKTKVLIVDDSSVVRQTLSEILSSDPDIEVMATASDPYVAVDRIAKQVPDVITLDVEMPRMDGITFLQKIMSQHPIPVVIISSLPGKERRQLGRLSSLAPSMSSLSRRWGRSSSLKNRAFRSVMP